MRVAGVCLAAAAAVVARKHHGHRHHEKSVAPVTPKLAEKSRQKVGQDPKEAPKSAEDAIVEKMHKLENALEPKTAHEAASAVMMTGKLDVNGPLPADFNAMFAQAVSMATKTKNLDCAVNEIKVIETNVLQTVGLFIQKAAEHSTGKTNLLSKKSPASSIVELVYQAPAQCVHEVARQAAQADSPLVADTPMFSFLVAKSDEGAGVSEAPAQDDVGVDIDTEMPYGELEPFGREDTAQELTEEAIKESDDMVDQIEKAQVAEEKRSVFRALTRLRGAAITSFDGVARSQTGNIDEYAKTHKWRHTHPLHHLAAEEADVTKWAFPATAD